MTKLKKDHFEGFFGIGIYHNQNKLNIGTLWRSAHIFGASFIFTINKKYEKQYSDTEKTWCRIPLYFYEDFDSFYKNLPYGCKIVAVELIDAATNILDYAHPKRCVYLLGSENCGLGNNILERCHEKIFIPGESSLNVAVAGSIVMYDRIAKN